MYVYKCLLSNEYALKHRFIHSFTALHKQMPGFFVAVELVVEVVVVEVVVEVVLKRGKWCV